MVMDNVIDVEHLAHRYGRRSIYADLNFSIPPGKVYGLLGKNGVGKTTLIKILMGFLRPESGRCRVFGENSHNLSPATREQPPRPARVFPRNLWPPAPGSHPWEV